MKNNQPLEANSDEIYTCWEYFVNEHVWKHQEQEIFEEHTFCKGLIFSEKNYQMKQLLTKITLSRPFG